ncbi:MAG: LptF/LptG family permease [Desulfonatronovibrio sp.]
MLSILNKYLLKQNLLLVLIILFSGISIYLIVDFVTRMNAIMESGVGAATAMRYFAWKIPLIIAQIMPAIFMLGVIVQLALMYRNKEMIALETNSISFVRSAFFFIVYAVAVFMIFLIFSETVGIKGYQATKSIWETDIRHKQIEGEGVNRLWFKEGRTIVFIKKAWPDQGRGEDISVYTLDGADRIAQVIQAPEFTVVDGKWILDSPVTTDTDQLDRTGAENLELEFETRLASFSIITSRMPLEALSMAMLGDLIADLRQSGSNIEKLSTAWHGKIAYAFALVVMTILGLALVTLIKNIYALVTLGLVIVFFYYTVYVFGVSYAEEGLIAPFWGAWLANILFGILGGIQILWSEKN